MKVILCQWGLSKMTNTRGKRRGKGRETACEKGTEVSLGALGCRFATRRGRVCFTLCRVYLTRMVLISYGLMVKLVLPSATGSSSSTSSSRLQL